MRLTTILSVLVLSTLRVATLQAQSRGEDLPHGVWTIAGVTLNRDSAASIRAKLGETRERRIGTGHDSYVSLCYVRRDRSSRTLLELMSDASDMGTSTHELNVIRLRADAPRRERQGCAPLPVSAAALSTPAGLHLGLARARILDLLGKPARSTPDSLVWIFDAKEYLRPGTPEFQTWNTPENREACFDAGPPYVNVWAEVVIIMRDRRASEIRLERYDQAIC
jgi:hypothetical protein